MPFSVVYYLYCIVKREASQIQKNGRQQCILENGECKPQIAQSSTRVATKLSGSPSSESMPTHILSQSYDQFLTSAAGVHDDSTLKGMWTKAGTLVSTPNMILPIPGKAGSRGRMVASQTGKTPHVVAPLQLNVNRFVCNSSCPRYASYKLCKSYYCCC